MRRNNIQNKVKNELKLNRADIQSDKFSIIKLF